MRREKGIDISIEKEESVMPHRTPAPVQSFLKTLRLRNFKSVQEANLELSNLNLLVGANSSGKSSLIQAILFLAQNARNMSEQASHGRMELNGALVGFGSFEETLCRYSDDSDRFIGLSGTFQLATRSMNRKSQRMMDSHFSKKMKTLEWSMELTPGTSREIDIISSRNSAVKYFEDGELIERIEYTGSVVEKLDAESNLSESLSSYFKGGSKGRFESLIDPSDLEMQTYSPYEKLLEDHIHADAKPIDIQLEGLTFLNGLPVTGYTQSTRIDTLLASQKTLWDQSFINFLLNSVMMDEMKTAELLTLDNSGKSDEKLTFSTREEALSAYVREINELLFYEISFFEEDPIETRRFEFLVDPSTLGLVRNKDDIKFNLSKRDRKETGLSIEVSENLKKEIKLFWADVEKRVLKESSHGQALSKFAKFPTESPSRRSSDRSRSIESVRENAEKFQPTAGGLREFNSFLAEKVRYLGPLRWDPREVYGFETMSPTPQMPLGRKGEMLAKKLDQNPVGLYPVRNEVSPNSRKRISLVDALEDWMEFMGIPGKISVDPIGAYGFRIKVDGKALAMIGTGISQVLPVVVLCLLSRPGDLILLEEPELHLNPGIQQKLMEFLLEMSKRDRSFIIETHSEYMVTRLRRLSVETPSLTEKFKIFFTEIAETGTEYREIKMDENGFITSWPKNFFDHAGNDLVAIMQKAAEIKKIDVK
jgi:predicted ATPase